MRQASSGVGYAMQDPTDATAEKFRYRPLGNRLIVRQQEWQNKVGSLFIPDGAREGYENVAEIRAIGPRVDASLDLKVGDRVMFKRKAGSALLPDPREVGAEERAKLKDLLVLEDSDLIAVVES